MDFADRILPDFDDKAHLVRRMSQYCRVLAVAFVLTTIQYALIGATLMAWVLFAGVLAMALCDWANRRGHLGRAVLLLLASLCLVLFSIFWIGGGLQDAVLLTVPTLLMLGGQLLRPRFFLVFAAVVLGEVAFVGVATLYGWRTTLFVDDDFNRLTDSTVMLAAAGAVVWFLSGEVQAALHKLRQEIKRYQASEENLTYLAQHDALTRLPNRRLGTDLMLQAMAAARRHGEPVALLFVDLDNFKAINDSLGHAAGDEFLQLVAQRLRTALRAEDILCRQGGDEFLVGLPRARSRESVASAASSLLQRFSAPFVLQGTEILPTCSVGIALFPEHGQTFDELLHRADLAMYQAKRAGRNAYRFFDASMADTVRGSLDLITGLRQSVGRSELILNYQPVVDLATGRVVGAEALVRWISPALGRIAPNDFIPAAESSGLIVEIGQWVLQEACRQMQEWHEAGHSGLTISVNLSPVQFQRGNIEAVIAQALAQSGLSAQSLDLEVTESTLVQEAELFIQTLHRLKAMGVAIAIDDFGTGYSNLAYLQRFAIDRIKVDQSFVRQITSQPQSLTLVTAIVQMAKGLGLALTAEGVEDVVARDALTTLGIEHAQGYYFAKPMTAQAFGALLRSGDGLPVN